VPTRGIFHKTCPSCASQVSVDEQRCGCGYSFLTDSELDQLSPDELLAQQQLEQEYIRARIAQAMGNLEVLNTALQADPKNFDKANKLMKAFADVRSLRAELTALLASSADLIGETAKALQAGISNEAPAVFRAAQAQKAEKIMHAAGMATKECSKCHAILPERAVLCFCGNAFSQTDTETSANASIAAEQQKGI
jgi:hypothetical protein